MKAFWALGGTAWAVLVGVWALWRGGPAERYGAAAILICWFLSPLVQDRGGNGPGIGVVMVDIALLIALVAVSLSYRRLWTIFAAAAQLVTVASHFVVSLVRVELYSYITAIWFWGGYASVIALTAGMIAHERRRKAVKEYNG